MIRELNCATLLDIPCGDFHWLSQLELAVEYTGADIVPEIVDEARRRYARPGRAFVHLDLLTDPLPRVDLVLCRDGLVHFSDRHVRQAVDNLRRSGSTYVLATTFPRRAHNAPIRTGQWRPLNLQAAPFHWPAPLELINENYQRQKGAYTDKSLGLWRIAGLPA